MAVSQVMLLAFFAMIQWDCGQSVEIQVQPNTDSNSLNVNCFFDEPSPTIIAVLAIQIVKPTTQGEEESEVQSSEDNKNPSELEDALATLQIRQTKPTVKDDSGMGRFSAEGYLNSSYPSASFLKLSISNISASDDGLYQCKTKFLDSSFVVRIERAETNVTVSENESQDVLSVAQMDELRDRLKTVDQNEAELKGKVDILQGEYDKLSESVDSLLNQTSSLNQAVHDIAEGYKSLLQILSGKGDINTPGQTTDLKTKTPHEQEQAPSEQEQMNSEEVRTPDQEKEAPSETQADTFIPVQNLTNSFVVLPAGANEGTPATVTRKCFVCGDPEAKVPCNGDDLAASSPIECPEGQEFCMNEIEQGMASNKIYKRCTSKKVCLDRDNSESPSCKAFFAIRFDTTESKCTFCCSSDACNNGFKPTEGLLKTGA